MQVGSTMIHSMAASQESLHNASLNANSIGVDILEKTKTSNTIITEDINCYLPMEVSSTESEVELDDDLLDDIDEHDVEEQEKKQMLKKEEEKKTGVDGTENSQEFRGRPSSCVFVASLAASMSDDELCISVTENFKQYGQLARVKVLRDHANRPYAFVQYKNDKDAKRALRMAQGSVLNGRTLRCESARVNRTLFITHVTQLQFNKIIELCEKFGELEQLVPNREQNQYNKRYNYPASSGYSWFVQFAYRDDAIRAFANLRSDPDWDVEWVQNIEVPKFFNLLSKMKRAGHNNSYGEEDDDEDHEHDDQHDDQHDDVDEIDGINNGTEELSDSETESSRFDTIDKKSIFIGQLDSSVTKEKLIDRFSNHGEIVDINLINKSTNIFAFIQFDTEEAAAAALERENHAIFLNKTMHVQYKVIGGHYGKRHNRRGGSANLYDKNSRNFMGPQVNLAPPPINMYRRRSYEHEPMLPYLTPAMPSHSDFEINPYNPYMKNVFRRTSLPNGWSSTRSYSLKSESENTMCGDGATDATSEISTSVGQANSATTYNNSSAGSVGQNNNLNENNKSSSKSKKRFPKRGGNHNFNEPLKPYYFQPYYYHPMHYPMGPLGPTHLSQGPGGNHPYMMVYPMPPPPPTGVDGSIIPPPIPMGQPDPRLHGSPSINQSQFVPSESNDFSVTSKPYNLDY